MPRERTHLTEEQAAELRRLRAAMDEALLQTTPYDEARAAFVAAIQALRNPGPNGQPASYGAIGEALGVGKQTAHDWVSRERKPGGWLRLVKPKPDPPPAESE